MSNQKNRRLGVFSQEIAGKNAKQLAIILKQTGKKESLVCPHTKPTKDVNSNTISFKDGFVTETKNGKKANIVKDNVTKKFPLTGGASIELKGKIYQCSICKENVFVPNYADIAEFANIAKAAYGLVNIVESLELTIRSTTEINIEKFRTEVGLSSLVRYNAKEFETRRLTKAAYALNTKGKLAIWDEIANAGEYSPAQNLIDLGAVVEGASSVVTEGSTNIFSAEVTNTDVDPSVAHLGDISFAGIDFNTGGTKQKNNGNGGIKLAQ